MPRGEKLLLLWALVLAGINAAGQRTYAVHSVLSSGNWYQLSVSSTGIYKIDLPMLASMGINGTLSSSSIKMYGNGGGMLPEACNGVKTDDLAELAIQVVDGGDGVLNGSDYILFYAEGPHRWLKDSINKKFIHQYNLYSEQSFYYLTTGTTGKRINTLTVSAPASTIVNDYNERFFHELDSINFLSGGKQWYGEEFSGSPGHVLTRNFQWSLPGINAGAPVQLVTKLAARSVGSGSRFDIRMNNQPVAQVSSTPVGGGIYDAVATEAQVAGTGSSSAGAVDLSYTYVPGSFNAQGWLNWFELFTRKNLSLDANQLLFRDWNSVGNAVLSFNISNALAGTQVWDVSDPFSPVSMSTTLTGTVLNIKNDGLRLHEYVAFKPTAIPVPSFKGKIANQDLHHSSPSDLLIITYPPFKTQAERVAQLHQQKDGMRTIVATTEQIFHEFSGGIPDPVAIRDFIKMYYDKYASNPANRNAYVLLFGDGSFDPKNRIPANTPYVPVYENDLSLDPLSCYASDDFFGFLDDNEDINSGVVTNLLDVGIGRIPARNVSEAENFVNKLFTYTSPSSLGPWRNETTFVADDEDNNLHLQDAELISATAKAQAPELNTIKIYLDAYHQETGAGGSSYPLAKQANNNQLFNGTLFWNYNGHGGSKRLAEETILSEDMVKGWDNANHLPLFITATCDVAPYDNPMIQSLGENILLRPSTGAIALMTTTRVVFAFSNRIMNNNYMRFALELLPNGKHRTLGEATMAAKNFTYQTSPDITNNRKFTLLGDPALRLAFPELKMRITSVNGIPATIADTLQARELAEIEGEVTDAAGNLLTGFNGTTYPLLFDKPQTIQTLGNDPTSPVTSFQSQQNILFRGKADVTNGKFKFRFRVPADINFSFGNGRLSLYADNNNKDANGLFTNFIVGGISSASLNDHTGPEIHAWLNDEMFVNGGLTNQEPLLLIKLADTSGINTTGTGIGHDIVATLDHDNRRYFLLNDLFEADRNSYQQGNIRFRMPELEPGPHTLTIKAWDALNNSAEIEISFVVGNDEELTISHVLNYPNPFTTHTNFWFEHNKPGQQMMVNIQVMTITGRVVKSIREPVMTDGNRSASIDWDGKDDHGDRLGRGVYLYSLQVVLPGRKAQTILGRLVIL